MCPAISLWLCSGMISKSCAANPKVAGFTELKLGLCSDGNPSHPLYLKGDSKPVSMVVEV